MEIKELEYLTGIAYKVYVYEERPIKRIVKGITKAEYGRCKKVIEEYRAKYKDVIPEHGWHYDYLDVIRLQILHGYADSVKSSAERFENGVNNFMENY